jgi:hypothetical protein
MTITVTLTLLVVAFICFVWAAIGLPSGRVNMIALGLALWVLSYIVH